VGQLERPGAGHVERSGGVRPQRDHRLILGERNLRGCPSTIVLSHVEILAETLLNYTIQVSLPTARVDLLALLSMAAEIGEETIRLPGGFVVRRRFTGVTTDEGENHSPFDIVMDLTVDDDGRSHAQEIRIRVAGGDTVGLPPLDDSALARIDLVKAKDQIMVLEALTHTPGRGASYNEIVEASRTGDLRQVFSVLDRHTPAAVAAMGTVRRRRQVTPELLTQVLDLYDQGGVQAVMDTLHFSESYSFKLLRKAREEQNS
jgi:hypothetical protein